MIEGMLAVLEPGMLETQVSQWGYLVGQALGAEGFGFDVMVTSGEDNRTLSARRSTTSFGRGITCSWASRPSVTAGCLRARNRRRDAGSGARHPGAALLDRLRRRRVLRGAGGLSPRRVENLPARFQELALRSYFKTARRTSAAGSERRSTSRCQKPYCGARNGGYAGARSDSARLHRIPTSRWAFRSSLRWTWPSAAPATAGTTLSSPASTACWWKRRWPRPGGGRGAQPAADEPAAHGGPVNRLSHARTDGHSRRG
jgi:hypothetical protein